MTLWGTVVIAPLFTQWYHWFATWANVKNEITTKLPKVCLFVCFLFSCQYMIMYLVLGFDNLQFEKCKNLNNVPFLCTKP